MKVLHKSKISYMAILLVFAMLAGIFPVGVFAEEDLVLSSEAGINEEYNESEGEETKENYTGTEEPVTEEEIDEESSTLENKLTYAEQIELSKVDIVTAISDLTVGNETTEEEILAAAQNASLYEVLVSWSETDGFYKIDATVDARGSITGSLVLTLEDASDYILVDKIIEQLPIGDEEKIDEDETKENDIETTESEVEEGSETFVSAQNIFKSSPVSLIMDSGNVTLLLDSSAENDNSERAEGASYLTLGGAISKAESGDTIKLVSDIVVNPGALIIESKDINLDLNGNNLTGLVEGDYSYNLIQLNGTANLEVTDSSEGVQGSLRGSSHIRPILNTGSGTVTVTNCTISSVDTYAIENASIGEVEVFNGSISSVNNYAINNSSIGTVNITSGTIRSDNRYPIYNASNGKVTILDSIISSDKSHGIVNETVGTIEISGGTVSSEEGYAIYNNNDGIVTISNCIVSSRNNGIAIYNHSSRTVSITDSTVSSVNNYAIFNGSTGSVVFNGGEATTSNYFAIGNNGGGNVTISGGSVFGKSGAYISWNNSSMLNISGGEVSSDGYTLVNYGIVNITGGTISTTREDKVCISSNSMVLNVSGGTLQHVKVNQVNISGDPIVKIAIGSLTSKKVSIIGELTGEAGDIILSGKGLTTTNEGTVVATAENEAHADASKFSLIDLEDKILSKDGSNIVIASNTFDLSNGSVTIDNNGEYTITQSGDGPTSNTVTINSDATIYLDGVDVLVPVLDSSSDNSKPNPININGAYTVDLYLVDGAINTLGSGQGIDVPGAASSIHSGSGKAGIRVPIGARLNIYGDTGILNAIGAEGMNVSDSTAHGGGGAGIGGNGGYPSNAEASGEVHIYGGNINSTGGAAAGYWGNGGTGIGGGGAKFGGNDVTSGKVTIYGGTLKAIGGDGSVEKDSGYGIGGELSIIDGKFLAESASYGNPRRSAIAIDPIRLPSSYKWRVREGDGYTLSTSEAYSRESNQRYVEIIPITIVSTLSFDSTGGTPVEQITQNYGTTITPPTAPTRTGYTFTGWSPVVPSTMPAQDLELIAQWEINQYTLSFDSTGGSAVEPITQDYGTTITPPTAPTRTGYTFTGWSPVVPSTMPAQDLELIAQWEINQYTLSFDSTGGSAVEPITQDYGTTITPPTAPTRTGYTFTGWSPVVPSTMPAQDLELIAQWEINQYTLSFDSTGGSAVEPITQDYGTTITPPTAPTRTGYTFTGWSPVVPSTMPAQDLELIAQWEINQYTLSFDSTGGSAVEPITQDYGTTITPPTAPTRTGYTFTGWSPVVPSTMPAQDLELIAQWEINQYTLSFDSTGGSAVEPITQDYGTTITPPTAPTRTGYTFTGWSPVVPSTMPAQDLELIAQWEINQYTLSFDSTGGSAVEPITQDYGTTITPPTAPTRTGYTFTGWSPVVPSTMPAQDLELIAQWEINQYTLSFDSTGGSAVEPITQDYGTTITPPTAPTRTGYTFTGWSPVVPSTMPAQDLELIAQWEINQYTLSFDSTGGSAVEPITQDYGTAVTSPTNPSRSGHRFVGWYLDQALTAVFDFDAFIVEDMVLYAKWNRISSDDGSSKSSTQLEPAKTMVIINGESTSAGTETKATEDGRPINLVQVNNEVIDNKIEEASKDTEAGLGNTIQIFSTDDDSQVVAFQLTGDMVKKLEENAFDVSVKSNGIEYTIPAREFTISNVAETLKIREKDLKAIQVQVRISKLDDKSLESYREVARENGAELIFTPVSFQVVAKTTRADGSVEEVRIEKFSSYVKRVMEIPAGTDPSKISTGIVFNLDGTYSHVPTEVFLEDGKWYARINSLTNSSYSVIWNPVTVESVASHWSKEVVNDMASRLIIRDPENFMPNENITRGEFAEYITRALGISRTGVVEEKRFIDLEITHELAYSIEIATEYGIIKGYPDGTFKPDEQISREEAMVMYSRAMDIAGLEENDGDKINSYNDRESIAEWAYEHARKTVNAGVFKGKTHETINPKDTFTCAEAATAIRNLLVAADLINK